MKKINNVFKDYNKYLSVSVNVYIIVLLITFILKLVGLDYFNLDVSNPTILKINKMFTKYHLINIWYFITLYIYTYCIVAIATNNKNTKIISLIYTIIGVIIKVLETYCNQTSTAIIDIVYLYMICLISNKTYKPLQILKRITIIIILTLLYQVVSAITRVNDLNMYDYNFIQLILLDMDYILLCLITLKVYFNERSDKTCIMEVGYSLQKKKNLKTLLKELHKNYSNFKKQDRQYKASVIIYSILSAIWNLLTLVIVIFVASLNETLIECVFMMISFWITKGIFGKAFHLKSMIQCFIVSNVTYYVMNRITTPLGISMFIPVILGVGLSYFTSKLVKKTYKPLYKGMSQELFDEIILQVTDKDSKKYKICNDYFVQNKTSLQLARTYNYSSDGIVKIASRINQKIKELNK